jgi:aspartyl-tRNA(Asn)/glutamyl-tRNA(Gln) amidotransferase subunit B
VSDKINNINNIKYETVAGLEVHAELSTETKAFCSCGYKFGAEVNTLCCPGCLGMPGALPELNRRVVDYALKIGLAAECEINKTSAFDRKNYFYPDLSKGYQITQHFTPLCENGRIEFYHAGEKRSVRISRIQIEEDTAKLLHGDSFKGALIDFNRCGVPLIEIISEPDLRSAGEVKDYLEAVRALLAALDICSCRMQEGAIRCDVNVSVRPVGQKEYGTKVEMKNVSTFSGAMQAVEYEAQRQIEALRAGKEIIQETRRWDEQKCVSLPMRAKENAADYRYFPESDLGELIIDDEWINKIKLSLPELPVAKFERYRKMGIPDTECRLLSENPDKAVYFEKCAAAGNISAKTAVNWIIGDLTARLNRDFLSVSDSPVAPEDLCAVIAMIEKGVISNDAGKRVLDEMFAHKNNSGTPEEIVEKFSLAQVNDEEELRKLALEVIAANQKSVADYKNGKSNALGFIVGQCMKASKGKGNPQAVNKIIRELIDQI